MGILHGTTWRDFGHIETAYRVIILLRSGTIDLCKLGQKNQLLNVLSRIKLALQAISALISALITFLLLFLRR